jgi:hypothetical protein
MAECESAAGKAKEIKRRARRFPLSASSYTGFCFIHEGPISN